MWDFLGRSTLLVRQVDPIWKMSVGKINMNREAPSLIFTHSHTLVLGKREKEGGAKKEED